MAALGVGWTAAGNSEARGPGLRLLCPFMEMTMAQTSTPGKGDPKTHMVFYCLIRTRLKDGPVRFLMIRKQGRPTFPPAMCDLLKEYAKPYKERDYGRIATITEQPWD